MISTMGKLRLRKRVFSDEYKFSKADCADEFLDFEVFAFFLEPDSSSSYS